MYHISIGLYPISSPTHTRTHTLLQKAFQVWVIAIKLRDNYHNGRTEIEQRVN